MKALAGCSAPLRAALGPEVLPWTHSWEETLFLEKQSITLGVGLVWPGAGLPWRMDAFPERGWGWGWGGGPPIQLDILIKNPTAETVVSDWSLGLTEPQGGFRDRGPWIRAVCCWGPCPWHYCDLGVGAALRGPVGVWGAALHGSLEPTLEVRVQQHCPFELKIEEELEIQPVSQVLSCK